MDMTSTDLSPIILSDVITFTTASQYPGEAVSNLLRVSLLSFMENLGYQWCQLMPADSCIGKCQSGSTVLGSESLSHSLETVLWDTADLLAMTCIDVPSEVYLCGVQVSLLLLPVITWSLTEFKTSEKKEVQLKFNWLDATHLKCLFFLNTFLKQQDVMNISWICLIKQKLYLI